MVVRKMAIRLAEKGYDLESHFPIEGNGDYPSHSISGIDHNPSLHIPGGEMAQYVFLIAGGKVLFLNSSLSRDEPPRFHNMPDLLDLLSIDG